MSSNITIKHSIYIAASPDKVWDFSQDYKERYKWDSSILEAEVLQIQAHKIVRIRSKGGLNCLLKYKLEDRPNKSSLAMTEVKSIFIEGGGGSWKYEVQNQGTLWTQTNTLILKKHWRWLGKWLKMSLLKNTRNSMQKAKQMIEA